MELAGRPSTKPEPDYGYFLPWGERIKGEGGLFKTIPFPSAARLDGIYDL